MSDEVLNSVDAGAGNVVDSQEVEQAEVQEQSESVNEEVTASQVEKPVQSKEDNAQYAQVRRDAEAKTRDKMISEMYGSSHNIHTYSDYQKAVEQEAEQQRRASLEEKGIDPSVFEEYINNNPTVKQSREILAQQEAQQKRNEEYGEFLEYFKTENGKDFNPSADKIPDEVWAQAAKGKSLTDAYAYHDSRQLRAKLKAFETNQANAQSSPGSLTGNGSSKDTTLTPEMIDSMTDKERMARWPEIKKVLGMK